MPNKKKRHEEVMKILEQFDPSVAVLAETRYYSKKQLFDGSTHRLREQYRDKAQARAILIAVDHLGKSLEKLAWFSKDEIRLLNAYHIDGESPPHKD